jgi:hypothetical protein
VVVAWHGVGCDEEKGEERRFAPFSRGSCQASPAKKYKIKSRNQGVSEFCF